jgi:hypothetical protein
MFLRSSSSRGCACFVSQETGCFLEGIAALVGSKAVNMCFDIHVVRLYSCIDTIIPPLIVKPFYVWTDDTHDRP